MSTYVPDSGDKLKFMANRKRWDDAIRKHLNSLQVRPVCSLVVMMQERVAIPKFCE